MFEMFTDRARRAVLQAQEEARMRNHPSIGTEHLLLGLIHEGEGVAVRALESLGISLEAVRYQVGEVIVQGRQAPSGDIPFSSQAKKALELSLREARRPRADHIGSGHILLGLISEGGVAAQVLGELGADLGRARTRVHGYPDKEPASTGAPQRGSATERLACRISTIQSQLSVLEFRINTIESRLSAVEFRVGTVPDQRGLDAEIAQTRRDKQAAVGERDFEAATSLQSKQRRLLDERDSRFRQWASAHPDPPSLAEQFGQLSNEIEQLRGLLHQQGSAE
jgi:ClpA/ClpB-like protein